MTKISKVRMKNFKSFKKATVPFAKGFTTIAGSNGSGKSNILDAILFGLGITSLKLVRASKLTDLVSHGAMENYAQVEVTLEEKGQEYELNRTIDKQGKSVYRLNGKRCSLHEINNLLKELNVRVDGHNIVIQGDITRIIEMNAMQRREIIDNVAGLKEFDEKKEEAIKELGKVDQKIKEVRIVLQERLQHLEDLEREKEAAMKYQEFNEELRKSKATLLFLELKKYKDALDLNELEEKKIESELKQLQDEKERVQKEVKELEKRFEEINEKLIKASEKTYEELGKEIEEKKGNIKVIDERIQSKQHIISKNRNKIEELRLSNENAEKETVQKVSEIKELNGKKNDFEKKIREMKRIIEDKEKDVEDKHKLIDNKQAELKDLEGKAKDESEIYYKLLGEVDNFKSKQEIKENQIKSLREKKESLDKKLREKQDYEEEIKRLVNSYGEPEQELSKWNEKLNNATEELAYNESKLEELDKAISSLNTAKASCPTCDTKLEGNKKENILSEKKRRKNEIAKAIENAKERKKSAKEKIEKINGVNSKINGLRAKTSDMLEIKQEIEKISMEIKEIEMKMHAKEFEAKETALNKSKERLKDLNNRKVNAENIIEEAGVRERETELNRIRYELDTLKEEKSEIVNKLNRLDVEVAEALKKSRQQSTGEITELEKEITVAENEAREEEEKAVKEKSKLKALEIELKKMTDSNKKLLDEKVEVNKRIFSLREKEVNKEHRLSKLNQKINDVRIEKSKNEIRVSDLEEEYSSFKEEKIIENTNIEFLRKRIPELDSEIKKLGDINMKAIKNYDEFKEEVLDIQEKSNKLDEERLAVLELIDKIEVKRTNVFMNCYTVINRHFNDMYEKLGGGEGKLGLTNHENPLESGLIIEAKHYGETLKNIDSMSGGEKSLTALAFLFAIQMYEPAPFYIFDEADAALDKANSSKLANMIKEISRESQFIAITHNDAMVEASDQIIGVTLNAQKSSVIGLKLKASEKQAGS